MSFEIWRKNSGTKQWECIPVHDSWVTQQTILQEMSGVRASLFTLAKAPIYGVVRDRLTPFGYDEMQVYGLDISRNVYNLVNIPDSQIDGSLKLYWMLTNG